MQQCSYEHQKCAEKQIRSNKDEQTLEEKSAIALHAIKAGHIVAFENAQQVITNVRNPYERLVAEQLTEQRKRRIATERMHQLSVQPGSLYFPVY